MGGSSGFHQSPIQNHVISLALPFARAGPAGFAVYVIPVVKRGPHMRNRRTITRIWSPTLPRLVENKT